MVSLVAPLYHPVYGWIEKIFQLIPKYFEAFNTNEYFTGLNLVSPITYLYRRETLSNCICVCQPCLQSKRECNFRNLLLKIIRHSFVIMLLSVACIFSLLSLVSRCAVFRNKTLFETSWWGWKSSTVPYLHQCWTLLYRIGLSLMCQIS